MNEYKSNSSKQSTFSNVQVEGDLSVGNIEQHIINLLSHQYSSLEFIDNEHQGKIAGSKISYECDIRSNQRHFYQELKNYYNSLFASLRSYKQETQILEIVQESLEKNRAEKKNDIHTNKGSISPKRASSSNNLFEELGDIGLSTAAFMGTFHAAGKSEIIKNDIHSLKDLIDSLEHFLEMDSINLDVDIILNSDLFKGLSNDSIESLKNIKSCYIKRQQEMEEKYHETVKKISKERDIKAYSYELKQYLKQDGYPLKQMNLRSIEVHLREVDLTQQDVDIIQKNVIEPYVRENLNKYKQAFKSRVHESFPLNADTLVEIKELEKNLGLEDFNFLRQQVIVIEQELIKPIYRENIKKYEQAYQQKLEQEGFPLSFTTISELNRLEKTLCLGDFQFPDCPELTLIKEELVKPFYQANLQAYVEAYRQKLYHFGINFAQNNIIELEKLRRELGFDSSYLESLSLQELFDLKQINKIELELVELVYWENIQSFELEYKRRLDKEGFSLSCSTISELSHLEEVLGLGSFQFQDCPEPAAIKEELLKPYYQANLQNYGKEYKKKLYQLGLSLAENHAPEVEKLRNNFGLNSAHIKNLCLQDQFTLEDDLSTIEKTAKDLFYEESLQCYAQEFSREVEISSCLAEQSNTMKESLQKLGIRGEDIKVVEGLIKNSLSIEHLFHERNSELSYWKLISFLAEHEWQKADILTRNLLLKLVNRSGKGFLDKGSVEKISARDVYTLDRLWVEYSNGLFGFSIQKKILGRVEQKKQPFAEAVGWSNQAGVFKGIFAWKPYNQLDFTLNAPKGHLPVWRVKGKEISVDDFYHLKIWSFNRNEDEPELDASITEDLSLILKSDIDNSRSDSSTTNILSQSFQKIFESINQFEIKKKVDEMGIDGFINQCAIIAATTGAASGFGGFTTMIVGVPFDVLNNVLQQFRVTLGVIYYQKGVYKVSFAELIKIVGVSVGVEVGATLTKSVMINLANKILVRLSASIAGKAVPFLGAAIGGSVNYGFVKAIGAAVKRIDMSSYTFQSEGSGGEIKGQ